MNSKIKAVVIDDESYIRDDIRKRIISKFANKIDIVEEASSVATGKKTMQKAKPQLVFLDIDLGDGTAFDILNQLNEKDFQLIFITGFDTHAIKAIKLGALDYILKPVDDQEFNEAVEKAIMAIEEGKDMDKAINISNHFYSEGKHDKIVLRTLEAIHIVNFEDIVYCHSEGNYTTFHLLNEKIMISKPMKKVEELLNKDLFLKCHQSYLVNTSYVSKYTSEGYLVMKNKAEVPVATRRKETVLRELF